MRRIRKPFRRYQKQYKSPGFHDNRRGQICTWALTCADMRGERKWDSSSGHQKVFFYFYVFVYKTLYEGRLDCSVFVLNFRYSNVCIFYCRFLGYIADWCPNRDRKIYFLEKGKKWNILFKNLHTPFSRIAHNFLICRKHY